MGQSSVEQSSFRLVETAAPPLAIGLRHDRVLLNSTVTCSANWFAGALHRLERSRRGVVLVHREDPFGREVDRLRKGCATGTGRRRERGFGTSPQLSVPAAARAPPEGTRSCHRKHHGRARRAHLPGTAQPVARPGFGAAAGDRSGSPPANVRTGPDGVPGPSKRTLTPARPAVVLPVAAAGALWRRAGRRWG